MKLKRVDYEFTRNKNGETIGVALFKRGAEEPRISVCHGIRCVGLHKNYKDLCARTTPKITPVELRHTSGRKMQTVTLSEMGQLLDTHEFRGEVANKEVSDFKQWIFEEAPTAFEKNTRITNKTPIEAPKKETSETIRIGSEEKAIVDSLSKKYRVTQRGIISAALKIALKGGISELS